MNEPHGHRVPGDEHPTAWDVACPGWPEAGYLTRAGDLYVFQAPDMTTASVRWGGHPDSVFDLVRRAWCGELTFYPLPGDQPGYR